MKCVLMTVSGTTGAKSPPSRGAWIEMILLFSFCAPVLVAPLAGGVD